MQKYNNISIKEKFTSKGVDFLFNYYIIWKDNKVNYFISQ